MVWTHPNSLQFVVRPFVLIEFRYRGAEEKWSERPLKKVVV